MKEEDLLKIALGVSLVGLFLLAVFSARLVSEEQGIERVNEFEEGKNIKTSGIIKSIKEGNKSTVIEIEQKVSAKVVVFRAVEGLNIGDRISVEGKVDEFNGQKQILADEIRKIEKD